MAIASGAENPSAFTSTKLRKLIATIAQLLSFSEGDVEQLDNFIGHSKDIQKTFYGLLENVFQVKSQYIFTNDGKGRGRSVPRKEFR